MLKLQAGTKEWLITSSFPTEDNKYPENLNWQEAYEYMGVLYKSYET